MKPKNRFIYILTTVIILILGLILALVTYFIVSASNTTKTLLQAGTNQIHTDSSKLINRPNVRPYNPVQSPANLTDQKCGQANSKINSLVKQTRIIGASDALPHSQPWIVSLRIYKNKTLYDHFCSGSLITTRHVLTSAHCVQDLSEQSSIIAVTGLHKRTDVSETAFKNSWLVINVSRHWQFNKDTLENDLAVLELSSDVQISENISVICLPDENTSGYGESTNVVVAGWGKNDRQSLNLQQVNLTLLENENSVCEKYLKRVDLRLLYCAVDFDRNANICSGDR